MFKNILVVYSEKLSRKHLAAIERVCRLVQNCTAKKSSDIKEDDFKDSDLVVTIGGDGTFIRASHFLDEAPILGINSEPETSEGALTSLREDEIGKLREILDGRYKIIQRERAKIKINDKIIEKHALNDIYIGSATQFHTSRYIIKHGGREEEQRSSGVLISTCTGSTAWYKSAGGSPFSCEGRKLKFLVREPYFGNLHKPKLLNGEVLEGEKIEFIGKGRDRGIVAIDSHLVFDFNYGDKIEIELSDKPLNVIVPGF